MEQSSSSVAALSSPFNFDLQSPSNLDSNSTFLNAVNFQNAQQTPQQILEQQEQQAVLLRTLASARSPEDAIAAYQSLLAVLPAAVRMQLIQSLPPPGQMEGAFSPSTPTTPSTKQIDSSFMVPTPSAKSEKIGTTLETPNSELQSTGVPASGTPTPVVVPQALVQCPPVLTSPEASSAAPIRTAETSPTGQHCAVPSANCTTPQAPAPNDSAALEEMTNNLLSLLAAEQQGGSPPGGLSSESLTNAAEVLLNALNCLDQQDNPVTDSSLLSIPSLAGLIDKSVLDPQLFDQNEAACFVKKAGEGLKSLSETTASAKSTSDSSGHSTLQSALSEQSSMPNSLANLIPSACMSSPIFADALQQQLRAQSEMFPSDFSPSSSAAPSQALADLLMAHVLESSTGSAVAHLTEKNGFTP
eukprot:Filipodium_phascolosomae@DN4550_c0_g1_i1.p1